MISAYFSTWNLIRISGFLAYFLFTLAISAGLMSKLLAFQKKKPFLIELHETSGWTGLVTTVFHLTVLTVDHYAPYKLKEIFIPLMAENAQISSAFGTISFFLFFIVIASSDFLKRRLGVQIWRKLHLLVIPAWILMLLHGIMIGTDSNLTWATTLYSSGIVLVMTLIVFRFLEGKIEARKKISRKGK